MRVGGANKEPQIEETNRTQSVAAVVEDTRQPTPGSSSDPDPVLNADQIGEPAAMPEQNHPEADPS